MVKKISTDISVSEDEEFVQEKGDEKGNLRQGYFDKLRGNPWIISTSVLGIVLAVFIVFSFSGESINGYVVSGDIAAKNLVDFIKSQGNAKGEVKVLSSEREGQLYKVTLNYQGQNVLLYVSLDGRYVISDLILLNNIAPALGNDAGSNFEIKENKNDKKEIAMEDSHLK